MRRVAVVIFLALLATVLVAVWEGRSEPLQLAEGQLLMMDGAPLANQTLIVEGIAKQPSWVWGWAFFKHEKFSRLVITDKKGYVQLVNMPAGTYTIDLVQPGAAKPVRVNSFTLKPGYTKYDFSAKLDEN